MQVLEPAGRHMPMGEPSRDFAHTYRDRIESIVAHNCL